MVAACLEHGVTPVVTLQHFTLPRWVARAGAWLNPDMVMYFGRYAAQVTAALGDRVRYFGTINEPGNLLVRGYLGTFPAPPFVRDLDAFDRAAAAVNACHRRAREVIKSALPSARVGMPHALQVWRANAGGSPARDWARHLHEDVFFETTAEDDFIGERIEYITAGLRSVARLRAEGLPVSGYFHWSLLDNFEWWDGYRPKFGLVAVDRSTQARTVKPSARFYGAVAAQGTLPPDGGGW